jgi:predicted dehydrogenase
MSKINFVVVGAGYIGKRHADMILENPDSNLVGFVDIRTEKECGVEKYNVPFFRSMDDLFKSDLEFDVVNICTPNWLHSKQSIISLNNDKHVVIEKPMGLHSIESEMVIYKALQKQKNVFCVMQNRYSPPSVWIKDVIEKKLMGEIYLVQLNCFWNRDERYYKTDGWKGKSLYDGGTLFTQFSHFIDIMYWLFGDIKNIQGKFMDFNHKELTEFEDTGIVNFDFINGGVGSINYSTSVNNKNLESSITIIGSLGSVKIGGQYMNEVVYCDIENYEMPILPESNPANDYGHYKGSAQNHNYIIQNVIDTLNGVGDITTNALDGFKIVDIIERIYEVKNKNFNK